MSKAKLATVKEELAEVSDPPKLAITASDIEIPRLNLLVEGPYYTFCIHLLNFRNGLCIRNYFFK